MDSTSPQIALSLVKDVTLLLLGVAGGYLVSAYFHRKQAEEKRPFEDQITDQLERIYGQAVKNGVRGAAVIHILESKRDQYAAETDLVTIKGKLVELEKSIAASEEASPAADLVEDVLEYKALGDRWSELVTAKLDIRVLNELGQITLERLLSAHKSLFPDRFAWAGTFRKQAVYVIDTFGTSSRIVDVAMSESRLETIAPDAIGANLDKLFSHWNSEVRSLTGAATDTKIDEVSHFHHEFQLIHPFLDGNGRIGRKILEEQLSVVFGSVVTFRPAREAYLHGLRLLDRGELRPFRDLVKTELQKFSVAL